MSENRSKLKIQLPSHHSYDLDDWSTESFEAPTAGSISTNVYQPTPRRKTSKSARQPAPINSTQPVGNTAILTIPNSPPTPDTNSKLYPFLRLHRQMSTSTPDFTKTDSQERRDSNTNPSEKETNVFTENSDRTGFAAAAQLKNSRSTGANLSNMVAERGLTAAAPMTRADGTDADNVYSDPSFRSKYQQADSFRRNSSEGHFQMPPKRPSNGFLTNLVFGNNLFDNRPLKVSDFDLYMCAPGSL